MPVVFIIISAIVALNLGWWRWAHLRLQRLRAGKIWRALLGLFVIGQILYLGVIVSPRTSHAVQRWVPVAFVAGTYLWSLLVLPVTLVVLGISKLAGVSRRMSLKKGEPDQSIVEAPGPSRRQLLGAAAIALPPLVTAGLTLRAVSQLSSFRVRTLHLNIPGMPRNLDSIRIAHVSDLHVGRYTRPGQIPAMVDAVNKLSADLVLFTGDLIDVSLDDLPRGINAMKQLDPRSGMAIIEGNHDLIDNADEFDKRMREAGLPLLVDEVMTVNLRGEKIQLLGARWGEAGGNRRKAGEAEFVKSIDRLSQLRDPHAFPILLAHHPHAFDAAAAAGLPLTLSGHTHGGQLMATSQVGFGPMFYRYWSGLYQKGQSQLVVNNGVGNWFPLRVNAPAEIVEIVLHATA